MNKDDEEVQAIVMATLGELLNIVGQVADMQTEEKAAQEIFDMCDLIAEYFQIERARAITAQHDDGSFTTRFETFTGQDDYNYDTEEPAPITSKPTPGHIRTKGKPKLRVIDCTTPLSDSEPTDEDLDNIED